MKVTSRRLATLEAKLRPRPSAKPRPWVMFESSAYDPTLFVGPGGALFTSAEVDEYGRSHHCRIMQICLNRGSLESAEEVE